MKTRIQKASFPTGSRVLVTSDIHGHADSLKKLLAQADYIPQKDSLVICGDMLEKGTENLGTLRYVMDLAKQGAVYPLIGNSDLLLYNLLTAQGQARSAAVEAIVRYKYWWKWTSWDETCREMGMAFTSDMDFDGAIEKARKHLSKELEFINAMPTILDTPNFVFVHAYLPHERLGELEGGDNLPYVKTDEFYRIAPAFSRWITVGHWPVQLDRDDKQEANPVVDTERRLICLDGGCGVKRTGQLNLMLISGAGELDFIGQDDHPRVRALDSQEESKGKTHYIKWTDRFIESSKTEGDISRVVFHGDELLVPAAFVSSNQWDGLICDDVTDYLLPVNKGDILYAIQSTSRGLFCKQDGVCGWYNGPFEQAEISQS